jgi:hypothetical protein
VLQRIAFESDGVRISLSGNRAEVVDRLPGLVPPGATACDPEEATESFGVIADPNGAYTFTRGNSPVSHGVDLEFGLALMQTQIRIYIGLKAPNRIFVHAGAVGVNGRAVLLPGRSFSGKTSLVAAFVRAGATYLSDEYAVLDESGLVHPYPIPLSVRDANNERSPIAADQFGGATTDTPLKVGAIVVTSFNPGGRWNPVELTPARAALALLHNTLAALERSAEALPVLRRATQGALLLEGERGEAELVVDDVFPRMAAEKHSGSADVRPMSGSA